MFTIGTYIGDDESSKFINLGYTPEFVLVFYHGAFISISRNIYGGLCLRDSPARDFNSVQKALEIIDGGFNVYYLHDSSPDYIFTNRQNNVYNYIAY